VRGGVKLKTPEGEPIGNWVSQRLMRVIEENADGEVLREALEYARLGQAKKLDIGEADVVGSIQGRMTRPYTTELRLKVFDDGSKDKVIAAMADQSLFAAKLLSGEMPRDIEDLFAPLGLRLFPTRADEIETTCTCKEPAKPWCKHALCVAVLLADRLSEEQLIVFGLRGLPVSELFESLRERRVLAGTGDEPSPVYTAHVPGASDLVSEPLSDVAARFWDDPSGTLPELPRHAPEVDKPLLRRLGASPFEARFPLVGLLATCYDLIAADVVAEGDPETAPDESDDDQTLDGS
jgi:uncharacterized Zn finger protein